MQADEDDPKGEKPITRKTMETMTGRDMTRPGRPYRQPRTRVVELQQAAHMMQTSGRREGYGPAIVEEWT